MSHDYRDVLLKAASRVEQEGMWYQGNYWPGHQQNQGWIASVHQALSSNLPACAIGTISIVAAELGVDDAPIVAQLRLVVDDIADWNDTPGRTAFEVAEAMRKAAE